MMLEFGFAKKVSYFIAAILFRNRYGRECPSRGGNGRRLNIAKTRFSEKMMLSSIEKLLAKPGAAVIT